MRSSIIPGLHPLKGQCQPPFLTKTTSQFLYWKGVILYAAHDEDADIIAQLQSTFSLCCHSSQLSRECLPPSASIQPQLMASSRLMNRMQDRRPKILHGLTSYGNFASASFMSKTPTWHHPGPRENWFNVSK